MVVTQSEWLEKEAARSLASRGDSENFEALFAWIWPWTVSVAGGEDQALVGWMKIIRDPSLWQKPLPYFTTLFKRAGIDEYRKEYRHQRVLVAAALEAARSESPESASAESKTLIRQLLKGFPSDYPEIVDLYAKKRRGRVRAIPGGEEIRDLAIDIFGNKTLAKEWLTEPNLATDSKPPIELLKTEEGLARVKTLLRRIDYGVLT